MPEGWDDDHLELVLRSVGAHLLVPEGHRVVPDLDVPRRDGSRRHRLLVAAAVVVALLAGALAIAPVREAVAGWFGLGSTTVQRGAGPVPKTLPRFLDTMTAITPADAAARLGRPLPTVGALGPPDAVLGAPEGGVVQAWDDGQVSLWVHRNPDAPFLVKKLVGAGARAEWLTGLGDAALWIGGPHVFESPVRRVQAASTVLWVAGDDEYRLEADLARDDLVRIARTVQG